MTLYRLIYRSTLNLGGSAVGIQQQVVEIVRRSEERNAAADLTGALLRTRTMFLQVLEGPLPAIEATFERICCDFRHQRVELVEFVQAETRVFGEWSMARITADRTIEKLFRYFDMNEEQIPDVMSSHATINLMRSLLVGPVPAQAGSEAPVARSLERGSHGP